jgi:hypothetical protein
LASERPYAGLRGTRIDESTYGVRINIRSYPGKKHVGEPSDKLSSTDRVAILRLPRLLELFSDVRGKCAGSDKRSRKGIILRAIAAGLLAA